jgi:hypothetical protein
MAINAGVLTFISVIIGFTAESEAGSAGVRVLYAARLAAALLVATVVPLVIDRRLRR